VFEAFRHNNRQYARLELASGSYYWFEYDFFNERYDLITMFSHNVDLQSQLEEAYQQHIL
jgi:hypothetical protein